MSFDPTQHPLSAPQARVLATLMEKARTVPDSYPMTLNSLVTGCNQKTSREPVMNLSDTEVQQALEALRRQSLVLETSGNRTSRWEHNFQRVVGVPDQSAALLGLLMLRGPQTAGELRLNAERWHRFADISSVEAFLHELQDRSADKGGPLVVLLPRAPGAREPRWAHLLRGPIEAGAAPHPTGTNSDTASEGHAHPSGHGNTPLQARIDALEAEVNTLRATVVQLCAALGITPDGAPMSPP